jgi:hypothetical protein
MLNSMVTSRVGEPRFKSAGQRGKMVSAHFSYAHSLCLHSRNIVNVLHTAVSCSVASCKRMNGRYVSWLCVHKDLSRRNGGVAVAIR